MTTYICEDCKHSFKNGWASTIVNGEIYTYCCYNSYKANPTILPTASKPKSNDNNLLIPIIKKAETYYYIENDIDDYYINEHDKYIIEENNIIIQEEEFNSTYDISTDDY